MFWCYFAWMSGDVRSAIDGTSRTASAFTEDSNKQSLWNLMQQLVDFELLGEAPGVRVCPEGWLAPDASVETASHRAIDCLRSGHRAHFGRRHRLA